jgi:hypothetical protein
MVYLPVDVAHVLVRRASKKLKPHPKSAHQISMVLSAIQKKKDEQVLLVQAARSRNTMRPAISSFFVNKLVFTSPPASASGTGY